MEKNPFQIRTELLKQAQEIATVDYWRELSKADSVYNYHMEKEEITEAKNVVFPVAPTASDIIKVAKELNNFISLSIQKTPQV